MVKLIAASFVALLSYAAGVIDHEGAHFSSFMDNSKSEDYMCTTCKTVIAIAETFVTDPDNVEYIEHYLQKSVCPQLPKDYQTQCKSLAVYIAENVADWIKNSLPPAEVCIMGGFCEGDDASNGGVSSRRHRRGQPYGGFELLAPMTVPAITDFVIKEKMKTLSTANFDGCQYCKDTIEGLKLLLTDEDKIVEIVNALTKVCNLLGDYSETCVYYVYQYVPAVLQLAGAYLQPELCNSLGYCEVSRFTFEAVS